MSSVVEKVCNLGDYNGYNESDDFLRELRLLVENGGDLHERRNSNTALHFAAVGGLSRTVALLLELGSDVNAGGKSNWTPLHMALLDHRVLIILPMLIDAGANVDARDDNGKTPLHIAVTVNNGRCVDLLLSAGANPEILDDNDSFPLELAVRYGNELVVQRLVAGGAPLSVVNGYNVFACAVMRGDRIRCLEWLLAAASLSEDGQRELSRLGSIVFCRAVDDPSAGYGLSGIEYLLAAGVDYNAPSLVQTRVADGAENAMRLFSMFRASTDPANDFGWYSEKRAKIAEKRIRLIDMIFERMLLRAFTICVALQTVRLPALLTLAVIDSVCDEQQRVPMYKKWNLITAVKHFS